MFKRKLYHNGDIYEGERFITKIEDERVLSWLLSKSPSSRKKYLNFPNLIDDHFQRECESNVSVRDHLETLGISVRRGEESSLEDMLKPHCSHRYLFIERIEGKYVYACRQCLHTVRKDVSEFTNI